MSAIRYHGYDKSCFKIINGTRIYLYKGMDLVNGRGWFCHAYDDETKPTFGFSKSKFTAVKIALKKW